MNSIDLMAIMNESYFPWVMAAILAVAGSFMYRWKGMNENDVPKIFESRTVRRVMCCVLIALGIFSATLSWWAFLAIPLAYYGIVTGHGSYFYRPCNIRYADNVDNENFAFITRMIADPLNCPARFVGMALTGLATTVLVASIPAITYYATGTAVVFGAWYALVGIMKPVIYHRPKWAEVDGLTERLWGAMLIGSSALVGFDFGFWQWIF